MPSVRAVTADNRSSRFTKANKVVVKRPQILRNLPCNTSEAPILTLTLTLTLIEGSSWRWRLQSDAESIN